MRESHETSAVQHATQNSPSRTVAQIAATNTTRRPVNSVGSSHALASAPVLPGDDWCEDSLSRVYLATVCEARPSVVSFPASSGIEPGLPGAACPLGQPGARFPFARRSSPCPSHPGGPFPGRLPYWTSARHEPGSSVNPAVSNRRWSGSSRIAMPACRRGKSGWGRIYTGQAIRPEFAGLIGRSGSRPLDPGRWLTLVRRLPPGGRSRRGCSEPRRRRSRCARGR